MKPPSRPAEAAAQRGAYVRTSGVHRRGYGVKVGPRVKVVVGLVGAAAFAAVVPGAPGAGQQRTLTLIESEKRATAQLIDEKPFSKSGRPSLGDQIIFVTPLLDPEKQRVGTAYGRSTVVAAGRDFDHASFLAEVVLKLRDGTINAQGYLRARHLSTFGISGGTGAYTEATGTIEETKTGDIVRLGGDRRPG